MIEVSKDFYLHGLQPGDVNGMRTAVASFEESEEASERFIEAHKEALKRLAEEEE